MKNLISYKNSDNKFLHAAEVVLLDENRYMHYRDITAIAFKKRLIKSPGKTPAATMNAIIGRNDIRKHGNDSLFIRGILPGYIGLRSFSSKTIYKSYGNNKQDTKKKIETAVKGTVAESRIIELISLYGKKDLVCYKPNSDIEGIDLIVKERNRFEPIYVQVKSTFGYGTEKGFVASIKNGRMFPTKKMVAVFVYFDLIDGDIADRLYCVPMPIFMKLKNEVGKEKRRVFTASINNKKENSIFFPYSIEKRELPDRLAEILEAAYRSTYTKPK